MKSLHEYFLSLKVLLFTLLKSRTSAVGQKTTLVFNYKTGFDAELSLYYFLKTRKLINGAGVGLYIGDRNDLKFSQKQFKSKLRDNPEFREVFIHYVLEELQKTIYDPGVDETEIDEGMDITTMILNSVQMAA